MGVRYITHDDLGDGRLRVFGQTDLRVNFDVVISREHFGGEVMWLVMQAAGDKVDKLHGATKARSGLTDSEE